MGKSQAVRLGPFTGGMNTASDPTAVADSEVVDVINLELDIDGSYVCRPPIVETVTNFVGGMRTCMIGRAIIAGVSYVIGSNRNNGIQGGTRAFDGTTWTTIKLDLESRVAIQYQDLLFIIATPDSIEDGGYWDGTTFTSDPNMPRGESAVFHKGRLFVAPGVDSSGPAAHQLVYTDPISISAPVPLTWPPSGVISVGQGDGEYLIEVAVYNDNLILFKQDSTYVLAYDVQPVDAILRKINSKIGASTRHCVALYENSVFVFHEGNIFEIINYDFQRINFKVPFFLDTSIDGGSGPRHENVCISTLGDRLVVKYFNRLYVYGLKTKTWTRWDSLHAGRNIGPIVEMPSSDVSESLSVFYAGHTIDDELTVYKIKDGYDAATEEGFTDAFDEFSPIDIECSLITKNYDLSDSHHYKKLFWWGADILSTRDIKAIASPITTEVAVTWDELSTHTWTSLGTWDSPLGTVTFVVETDVGDITKVARKFVKFLKALRWRQINFEIRLLSNGSTTEGPCRFFTFTLVVSSKETVTKQVN